MSRFVGRWSQGRPRLATRVAGVFCVAFAVVGTACTQSWSTHLRTRFLHPAITSCVEEILVESPAVDTAVTLADHLDGYFVVDQSQVSAALPGQSYSEVAFAGSGGRGQLVQTVDSEGLSDATLSWTWSEQRPSFQEAQQLEQWLMAYLQRICLECAGDSTLKAADVAIVRDWIPADSTGK
jgi:hypothetical protein